MGLIKIFSFFDSLSLSMEVSDILIGKVGMMKFNTMHIDIVHSRAEQIISKAQENSIQLAEPDMFSDPSKTESFFILGQIIGIMVQIQDMIQKNRWCQISVTLGN